MSEYSSILVTSDFSNESLAGVDTAASLARRLGAQVTVLYVVEDQLPPIIPFTSEEDRRRILEEHRERAAEKLETYVVAHFDGLSAKAAVVVGVPALEIVRFAEENDIDFIVMSSRGYGPIRQLALGSTTERVLHHAPCPVFVVGSKKE